MWSKNKNINLGGEKWNIRPNYSKQIHIDEDGGVDLIPNPRTVSVKAVSKNKAKNKKMSQFQPEMQYLFVWFIIISV